MIGPSDDERIRWPRRWTGPWHCISGPYDQSTESYPTETQAQVSCAWLNDHELRCGRPPGYVVVREP